MTGTLALLFTVGLAHVAAAWHAARKTGESVVASRRTALIVGAALAALVTLSTWLAQAGLLANFEATPPYLMRFVLPHMMFAAMIGGISPYGRRLSTGLPMHWLIAYQAFRIPVELLLHDFYRQGLAPVQITYLGRNFDIVSGISAIPVAWLTLRGKASRPLIWVWNLLGLLLLVNIAAIAITSLPGPFRVFHNEPSTAFLARLPYIFVPTFFAPTALLGHVLVFRKLRLEVGR